MRKQSAECRALGIQTQMRHRADPVHSPRQDDAFATMSPATRSQSPMHRAFAAAAHLALWAGLYVAGAVVCLAQTAGLDLHTSTPARTLAFAFAFCTAAAVYLLDRIKLIDAWLDPADQEAHPERFSFLTRHAWLVRSLMLVLLIAAGWMGDRLLKLGELVPLLAASGVLLYAARPKGSRPRPKDVLVLKNSYVAAGITGFAAITILAAAQPRADWITLRDFTLSHTAPLVVAAALLAVRIFADAVLCDIDDESADRNHGTWTLPSHFGRARAWNIALALRLGIAAALVFLTILPAPARFAWAATTVTSSLILRFAQPVRLRDWVDARLAIEAAVASVILAI